MATSSFPTARNALCARVGVPETREGPGIRAQGLPRWSTERLSPPPRHPSARADTALSLLPGSPRSPLQYGGQLDGIRRRASTDASVSSRDRGRQSRGVHGHGTCERPHSGSCRGRAPAATTPARPGDDFVIVVTWGGNTANPDRERSMGSVYKVIEIVGTSSDSWEDATRRRSPPPAARFATFASRRSFART